MPSTGYRTHMNWNLHLNAISLEKQKAIADRYSSSRLIDLSEDLGVSVAAIHHYAARFGLKRKRKDAVFKRLNKVSETEAACSKCESVLLLEEFSFRRTLCTKCVVARALLNSKRSEEVYWQRRYVRLRSRARKAGIPFNLERYDLLDLWRAQEGKDFYTDIPMDWGDEAHRRTLATVDKVDVQRGYVRGNVVLCTWLTNSVKCDLTLDELRLWIPEWYRRASEKTGLDRVDCSVTECNDGGHYLHVQANISTFDFGGDQYASDRGKEYSI